MNEPQIGLWERTRRAVRKEITKAARALFVEQGYEATTIDEIAAAVGMSQRSVFRYFPTKEDIVLGKFDFVADEMLSALSGRTAGEPVWQSLRRMFDLLLTDESEVEKHHVAEPIQRIIFETPPLFASYLQRLHQLQDSAVGILLERAEKLGTPYADDDPAPRALTAAAFGCLVAAQHAWLAGAAQGSFAEAIDRAMAALRPTAAK